jgi:amino acid adenylation domain-containing protein
MDEEPSGEAHNVGIAIIGMAGRFPGASTLAEFWKNIRTGKESISSLSDEELRRLGINDEILSRPDFVKAGAFLDNTDLFDAAFFNYSPIEAEYIDPQHRVFLECAVEALEDAACDPFRYSGSIGVFAGAGISTYQHNIVRANLNEISGPNSLRTMIALGTDKDFLATRVSYKLNLAGPSLAIQTACSTSLVAVHVACQSLLAGECDLALAGGVSVINGPRKTGYMFIEGDIMSPDGHCRPFDVEAKGTVSGDGAGIVVLKRLDEALKNCDRIYAIIRGSAVNNDGSAKIGYTAPSVDGQAAVVSEALSVAGIGPEAIQYIETHGTGTALGDPIEIRALQRAFRGTRMARGSCAIGSLKSNIGHLNTAAGVAGLIKTALALREKCLPPSINFSRSNPQIDFDNSPFYVNCKAVDWQPNGTRRRAGVSSFGIGGTNAHVVLEEAPPQPSSGPSRKHHLLLISAKTVSALELATANMVEHLRQEPNQNLADICFTLSIGRRFFPHRRAILCRNTSDVVETSDPGASDNIVTGEVDAFQRPLVFMFPGQGSQYVNMARGLYEEHESFRSQFDDCAEIAQSQLGRDLRDIVFTADPDQKASEVLCQTEFAQPAIFSTSYAMAKLWEHWGVRPSALIGHSIGEFVAACLAGVFSLEDALALVVRRGKLMQSLPTGSMLAVPLDLEQLQAYLAPAISVAAENGPTLSLLSGSDEAINELERRLRSDGVEGYRLRTSHAFHSVMMEPIVKPFLDSVAALNPKAPQLPYVSNVTGTWVKAEEATSPAFWARHLRAPVKLWSGFRTLVDKGSGIFVEVGPGSTLTGMLRGAIQGNERISALASIRHPGVAQDDSEHFFRTVAQLWVSGVTIDWRSPFAGERRNRVALPTYPFERQRYWIDPRKPANKVARVPLPSDTESLFHVPHWTCLGDCVEPPPIAESGLQNKCLAFVDDHSVGARLAADLQKRGYDTITVERGSEFAGANGRYRLSPDRPDHFRQLMKELAQDDHFPHSIVYLWPLMTPTGHRPVDQVDDGLALSFFAPIYLGRAIGEIETAKPISILFVTDGAREVIGSDLVRPLDATIFGPTRVISQEYRNLFCRHIDIASSDSSPLASDKLIDNLVFELTSKVGHVAVAYRRGRRWLPARASIQLDAKRNDGSPFRHNGVYLVTGGLGDLGLEIAKTLFDTCKAKLVLVSRSALPDRELWQQILRERDAADPDVRRILGIQFLESRGAEVMVVKADIANLSQMKLGVSQVLARFGPINGVVHAAGVAGAGPISIKTKEELQAVLAPKVLGTMVLEELLSDQPLDFLILFSSIASWAGGLGQVAYTAANAFLDAYAKCGDLRSARRTISINWDAWREIGMAVNTELPKVFRRERKEWLERGLDTSEALEAFVCVAASSFRQVIVTKRNVAGAFAPLEIELTEPARKTNGTSPDSRFVAPRLHPRPALRQAYVAPSTAAELVIAGIWQEFLGIDRIGVHDDFSELGGHSLLATRVMARLREVLEVELPVRALFEAPTVSELAERVAVAQREGLGPAVPALEAQARPERLPLSYAQERLWVLEQLGMLGAAYNIPTAVRLVGALDVGALERTFSELVRRHEGLRTRFVAVDGSPVQLIEPAGDYRLEPVDLSGLGAREREAEVGRLAREEALRPFDLAMGPLFRATLLKVSSDEHVVLVTMHHIVSDGWSIGVLIREVGALYAAFMEGKPSPLSELPVQYADYALWQRKVLQGEVLEQQLAYWKEQLSGALAALDLPTDRVRPAVQSFKGGTVSFVLSKELMGGLIALARREGATLFMVLLAAFKALLLRCSGQADVVVGSPIAGRKRRETEGLIGLFADTLVLRTDLSGDPKFRELLRRVKEVALGAYAHQDVPFEKVVEVLRPERSLSHQPLFQIMLALQNMPMEGLRLPGLVLSTMGGTTATSKFDLTLFISETRVGLHGTFEYSTDLFDGSTIGRLVGHFKTLLEGVVADPDHRLSELPLLSEAERRQLKEWNETAAEYPRDKCLHELFAEQAAKTPDALAVVFGDQELTYAELDRLSNQVAHRLRDLGVGPETVVGLCVERSVEMVIGLLGILKAGGAYLALDPSYPPERLAYMLAETRGPVLVTQARLEHVLPEHSAQVLRLDTDWKDVTGAPGHAISGAAMPDNIAYVLYTSGSTGRPKGVTIAHRSAVALMEWAHQHFTAELVGVLASTSICFDLSIFEVFAPLTSGGTAIIAATVLDLQHMPGANRVTMINTVPSAMQELVRLGILPNSVRTVNLAGEALGMKLVQDLYRFDHIHRVCNLYGPSEDTTYSTGVIVPKDAKTVTIGRPIYNTRAYVLDRGYQPVPIGVVGELSIGGVGLARGYLFQAGLTAERFVPSPFGDGERLYRTGDLARWRSDGELEYLGRVDFQVKMRGFRIELGEIEATLSEHPGVAEAVVVAREEAPGEKRLVGYVVTKHQGGIQPEKGELLAHLARRLPGYMIPSSLVVLDGLPLTPNGKVDRKALPRPEGRADVAEYVGPRTPAEEALVDIWCEVLKLDRVGVHDNFFELGGHSLLAVQLFARIGQSFGNHIPIPTLFERPTIAALSACLRDAPSPIRDITKLRSGDLFPPLFLVHPAGVTTFGYIDLANRLRTGQAVYAVQCHSDQDRDSGFYTIDEMARCHVNEMRAVQPRGPYLLAGWSIGGIVAFEMAQQLTQEQEQVALLALIDSYPSPSTQLPEVDDADRWIGFIYSLFPSFGSTLKSTQHEFWTMSYEEKITFILNEIIRQGKLSAETSGNILCELHRRFLGNMRSWEEYTIKPYSGEIVLFEAMESNSKRAHENRAFWKNISCDRCSVIPVPGDHYSLITHPNVDTLATNMSNCLLTIAFSNSGPPETHSRIRH